MRLAQTLILAGALGVSACAPGGFAVSEYGVVEQPFYADPYGPVIVQEPGFGYFPPPVYARPPPLYSYGYRDDHRYARERERHEWEARRRHEVVQERRQELRHEERHEQWRAPEVARPQPQEVRREGPRGSEAGRGPRVEGGPFDRLRPELRGRAFGS